MAIVGHASANSVSLGVGVPMEAQHEQEQTQTDKPAVMADNEAGISDAPGFGGEASPKGPCEPASALSRPASTQERSAATISADDLSAKLAAIKEIIVSKRAKLAFVAYRAGMIYLNLATDWYVTIHWLQSKLGAIAYASLAILLFTHTGTGLVGCGQILPRSSKFTRAGSYRRFRWLLRYVHDRRWLNLPTRVLLLGQGMLAIDIFQQEMWGPGQDPKYSQPPPGYCACALSGRGCAPCCVSGCGGNKVAPAAQVAAGNIAAAEAAGEAAAAEVAGDAAAAEAASEPAAAEVAARPDGSGSGRLGEMEAPACQEMGMAKPAGLMSAVCNVAVLPEESNSRSEQDDPTCDLKGLLPYEAHPYKYGNDGFGWPAISLLNVYWAKPETFINSLPMLVLQSYVLFTSPKSTIMSYISVAVGLMSTSLGAHGMYGEGMRTVMQLTVVRQMLVYVHLLCEYGLRAFTFAVLAAALGWRCAYYVAFAVVSNALMTVLVDDVGMDPHVSDPGYANSRWDERSRLHLMARQFAYFYVANMCFVTPIAPFLAFSRSHILKFCVRMTEHVVAISVALWGVGECPLGRSSYAGGLPDGVKGIEALSCRALLGLLLGLAVTNCAAMGTLVGMRGDMLLATTFEEWHALQQAMECSSSNSGGGGGGGGGGSSVKLSMRLRAKLARLQGLPPPSSPSLKRGSSSVKRVASLKSSSSGKTPPSTLVSIKVLTSPDV